MATLQSKIILCKGINVDKNYVNVLDYKENQMLSLCESQEHLVAIANDYSFIRNRGTISTNFKFDDALKSNYIAFQNKDYSNKWFFAWIDEVNFIGEENTEIKYTIDAWSTWFDYWQKKVCFINRQHVNDDTIGIHTVPENLDVGEVVQENATEDIALSQYYWIGVLTNYNPLTKKDFPSPLTVYAKNIFPKTLCLFDATDYNNLVNLGLFLIGTNADKQQGEIDNIFFISNYLIDVSKLQLQEGQIGGENCSFYTTKNSFDIVSFTESINKQYSFNSYQPKNNKCYVYPYNFLFVSNNIGNQNIYKYENFSTDNCQFEIQGTISIGGSTRLVPKNYKQMQTDDDEVLTLAKFPTIAWSNDSFTNWLTTQAVNIPTSFAKSLIPSVGTNKSGATTVDASSNIISVASNIADTIGAFYQASLLPDISQGQNNADINFLANRNTFTFRNMRVKDEYLKIIDDYFTRFGYAIKKLEMPNIVGRKYWNYVEIGASEEIGYGDVPNKFMEIINNACRKGVTIWHNHANIGNYSLNNTIK